MRCRAHPEEACPLAATMCTHATTAMRPRHAPMSSMATDRLLARTASGSSCKEEAVQGSPWGAVAPGCRGVHKQQPHQAPHTGAYEQHGHEQAAGDGAPRSPDCPQEVEHQHHDEGAIVELPVGAAAEQVLDCILACNPVNGAAGAWRCVI